MTKSLKILAPIAALLGIGASTLLLTDAPADADFEITRQEAVAECIDNKAFGNWSAADDLGVPGHNLEDFCRQVGWHVASQELEQVSGLE